MCRNSTVSSDSHLEIGHRWSDQRHLGCFKYSYSSVPVYLHFLEATWWGFSIYKTAHRAWLRILST